MTTAGKVVLLSGGTAGLGTGILKGIVASGPPSKIILLCRSEIRGRRAAAAAGAESIVQIVLANLDLMAEVYAAGRQLATACASGEAPRIDLVFLNAACFASAGLRGRRVVTPEGLEAMFATNHAAQFVLLRCLASDALSPRARVVITGSDAAEFLGWKLERGNLQGERSIGVGGFTQYSHTKLMNGMFAAELQARADEHERAGEGGGIDVSVVHPGAVRSELGNNVGPWTAYLIKTALSPLFRTPDVAAPLLMAPALSERPLRGYIGDGNIGTPLDFAPRPFKGSAASAEERRWLWDETERLVEEALGSVRGGTTGCPRLADD